MSKADSTEFKNRVNTIYAMLLQGYQRKQIVQFASKKYEVSDRQVDTYLSEARKVMSDEQDVEIGLKRSEVLCQLYDLYNKNFKSEDYRECRNVLTQIAGILGVNAPIKSETEITAVNINPIEWVE